MITGYSDPLEVLLNLQRALDAQTGSGSPACDLSEGVPLWMLPSKIHSIRTTIRVVAPTHTP